MYCVYILLTGIGCFGLCLHKVYIVDLSSTTQSCCVHYSGQRCMKLNALLPSGAFSSTWGVIADADGFIVIVRWTDCKLRKTNKYVGLVLRT